MSSFDLVFKSPPLVNPAALVFGEVDYAPPAYDVPVNITGAFAPLSFTATLSYYAEVSLTASFPLTFSADVREPVDTYISGTFPELSFVAAANYNSDTARPTVGQTTHLYQSTAQTEIGVAHPTQDNLASHVGWQSRYSQSVATDTGATLLHEVGLNLNNPTLASKYQEAIKQGSWPLLAVHADGLRDRRDSVTARFEEAIDRRASTFGKYEEMLRDRRPSARAFYKNAVRSSWHNFTSSHQKAGAVRFARGQRFQEAIRPPPGVLLPPEPPLDPCYIPNADLVFRGGAAFNGGLLFVCDFHIDNPQTTTIVVPIRSVYVVTNEISLRRVSGNVMLPTLSLSLSIDADSWAWGFSASLPASTLDALQPTSTGPVELEANINGNLYRVLAEQIGRERSFGNASIRVTGRGKTALLASPYSPVLTFANAQQRSAQQLMADVLTFNNVPLGWSIDWQLDNWLVPAGAFAVRGTYIEGLTAIAGAAGAYLKPDPVAQSLSVLLRYPVAPWDWATDVTPDYSLPSSVTIQEGIEWLNKPDYNRVFVSGTSAGVLGQVTREGTAGDLAAQMITDPLITEAAAARQRGLAVLADTGKQARVRLRLPVLASTGVIDPGRFVQYSDGLESRLGLVRSTSVDASWPEAWQTIELETHL